MRTSPAGNSLNEKQAAEFLGVSASTLRRDRAFGHLGVPFVSLGARVLYLRSSLEKFLADRERRPAAVQSTPAIDGTRRGRPTKIEQVTAAQLGISVPELRARNSGLSASCAK